MRSLMLLASLGHRSSSSSSSSAASFLINNNNIVPSAAVCRRSNTGSSSSSSTGRSGSRWFDNHLVVVSSVTRTGRRSMSTTHSNQQQHANETDSAARDCSSNYSKSNNNLFHEATSNVITKDLWIVRHGQARHNPRAEAARAKGCTHDEFLEFMRLDDCLDAPLTTLGRQQAQRLGSTAFQVTSSSSTSTSLPPHRPFVVVSSPLSRALQTAEMVLGYPTFAPDDDDDTSGDDNDEDTHRTNESSTGTTDASTRVEAKSVWHQPPLPRLVCYEGLREINGWLLNGQRQRKSELQRRFPRWNFDAVPTEEDILWDGDVLEDKTACGQRGRAALVWVATHCPESSVLIVTHGAILNAMLAVTDSAVATANTNIINATTNTNTNIINATNTSHGVTVHLQDGRKRTNINDAAIVSRSVHQRYDNCELRRYQMQCTSKSYNNNINNSSIHGTTDEHFDDSTRCDWETRTTIVLTEVDLDHVEEDEPL